MVGSATGDIITANSFENLTGSSYSDTLTGNAGNNTIVAGAGNDTVDGGNGDDLIYLGDGNDYLNITSSGNDTFHGGNGATTFSASPAMRSITGRRVMTRCWAILETIPLLAVPGLSVQMVDRVSTHSPTLARPLGSTLTLPPIQPVVGMQPVTSLLPTLLRI